MNTIEYLNLAKRRLGIESDYALAKALGMARSNMSSLVNGKTTLSDEYAMKLAKLLGIHPAIVIADMHAEREKNPDLKALWFGIMEKFSVGFEVLTSCVCPRGIRVSA